MANEQNAGFILVTRAELTIKTIIKWCMRLKTVHLLLSSKLVETVNTMSAVSPSGELKFMLYEKTTTQRN
ncbi:MAG: hypothetical protein LBU04_00190 [Christensenellaceae bacterium]|jgi:hypothetical protein|nr:hypothetical protein [Christensenellaceae bacterium]